MDREPDNKYVAAYNNWHGAVHVSSQNLKEIFEAFYKDDTDISEFDRIISAAEQKGNGGRKFNGYDKFISYFQMAKLLNSLPQKDDVCFDDATFLSEFASEIGRGFDKDKKEDARYYENYIWKKRIVAAKEPTKTSCLNKDITNIIWKLIETYASGFFAYANSDLVGKVELIARYYIEEYTKGHSVERTKEIFDKLKDINKLKTPDKVIKAPDNYGKFLDEYVPLIIKYTYCKNNKDSVREWMFYENIVKEISEDSGFVDSWCKDKNNLQDKLAKLDSATDADKFGQVISFISHQACDGSKISLKPRGKNTKTAKPFLKNLKCFLDLVQKDEKLGDSIKSFKKKITDDDAKFFDSIKEDIPGELTAEEINDATKLNEKVQETISSILHAVCTKSEIEIATSLLTGMANDIYTNHKRLVSQNIDDPDIIQMYKEARRNGNITPLRYKEFENDNAATRNMIYFGAPGTGKSFQLKKDLPPDADHERVTFHPDYSYFDFVGSYKPVMVELKTKPINGRDSESVYEYAEALPISNDSVVGSKKSSAPSRSNTSSQHVTYDKVQTTTKKRLIQYEFVPGPFARILVRALVDLEKNRKNAKQHYLIIEEINRARAAAVFGDMFQLLDRNYGGDYNGASEYSISLSEELKSYIQKEFELNNIAHMYNWETVREIRIPSNMYIWATMNSADQGVYPLDTAFKRRWRFKHIGIDDAAKSESGKHLFENGIAKKWNDIRKRINSMLISLDYQEDRQLGPFFIAKPILESNDESILLEEFKDKVLMYLREDIVRNSPDSLFKCDERESDEGKRKLSISFSGLKERLTELDKVCDIMYISKD